MTKAMPRTAPKTAIGVAGRLLRLVRPTPDLGDCEIDWAGPVKLPLSDERAVQAACGIMHVHGRASGQPTPLAIDYASTVTGVLAAQGVLALRVARQRDIPLRRARTSVAQGALLAISQYLAAATADDDWPEPLEPGMTPLTSADGVQFEIETLYAEPWQRFWHELGADRAAMTRTWPAFQRRFGTASCGMHDALRDAARQWRFPEIEAVAERTGVSALPLRQTPDHPSNVPAWTYEPLGKRADPPRGGSARPLDGITVVESTRRVQGPLAGHVLRMLGADVVRIEPPGGDPMRGIPPMAGECSARFSALNAGKRVVEIDIKSMAGRGEVRELLSTADVFLHNWAPGKAAELGLDAGDLVRRQPGLVCAWASGWSGVFGAHAPMGTDFLVQSHSGLAAALRPAHESPAPSLMTLTDILGGLLSATAVLAGLDGRLRTGHGARVESSLFSAAGIVPRPVRRPVWTECDHPLRTRDGHVVVDAPPTGGLAALCQTEPTAQALRYLHDAGLSATPVCADLRTLAADPTFDRAIGRAEYAFPLEPWEFC